MLSATLSLAQVHVRSRRPRRPRAHCPAVLPCCTALLYCPAVPLLQVRLAVFSQHHVDGLDLALTPLQYMCKIYPEVGSTVLLPYCPCC